MPLFNAPFRLGRCTLCHADLCCAKSVPLSPFEQAHVQSLTEDLTYLLSEPSDSLPLSLRRTLVRQQLAFMQRAVGKPGEQMDHGRPLLGYLHRLQAIDANFRMLFDEGIWLENALLQDPERCETPEARQMGAVLAERITTMQREMAQADLPVTRQVIADRLRVPLKLISLYSEVQSVLTHIPSKLLPQRRERIVCRQAELFPCIPQAMKQMEQEGKSLSADELGRLLQTNRRLLCQLPGVMTGLAELRKKRRGQIQVSKRAERERELVACVEATITQMRERGEQVTAKGICKALKITYVTACKYPQVKALLSPFRKDQVKRTHETRWQAYHQTRDAELVEQITVTAHLLLTEGKLVTPYTICRAMRVTLQGTKPYSCAWALLERYRLRQEPTTVRAVSQEELQLITQLEVAIAHFDTLGVRITHTLLCNHLHIPMKVLAGRYPLARALMIEAKKRTSNRPHQQIENLYERVVRVIQEMEAEQKSITRNAICVRLQVSVHRINQDQEVKALIAGIMARRSVAETIRRAKREDELIECLHKAYASLAVSQEFFSCTRLYIVAGKDDQTFRRYPQVKAVAEQLVTEHEQDVRSARSAFVTSLVAHTTRIAREMLDVPVQISDEVPQPVVRSAKWVQWRRDRDATLAAEVVQVIRELEQHGQEVTYSAICALTGWDYQTLCNDKYPQTQQLMRRVVIRPAVVTQQRQAKQEAELVCKVRQAYVDLQQSDQPVLMKTIAKMAGRGISTLRSYPAVKVELERIREDIVSRYQWERQGQETELLIHLNAYVRQYEMQEQPLVIRMIEQELGMPLATILGYPRLRERIEQIRSAKRAQHSS